MQSHAKVVIVGGGMMGVGLAYHLAEEGWKDVVADRKGRTDQRLDLACGGPVPVLHRQLQHGQDPPLFQHALPAAGRDHRPARGLARLRRHSSGDHTGRSRLVPPCGRVLRPMSVSTWRSSARTRSRSLNPWLVTDGVLAGAYTNMDGHVDPASACNAMAAGARQMGATHRAPQPGDGHQPCCPPASSRS